ncbi:MAG: hypothetical protein WBH26_04855 [Pontimonas sp.]|jgi:hypothetical protein
MSRLGPLSPRETGPITEVSVTEISVETTGVMPVRRPVSGGTRLSKAALGTAVAALVTAPVFGLGLFPAIVAIILGHIGKKASPAGRMRSTVALALGYVALAISTAVLVFILLPLSLAFLVSAGYILEA